MLKIALYTFNAITPILGLIFLGYFLNRSGFLNDEFIRSSSRVVFRLALPVQLFCNIYQIDSLDNIRWDVAVFSVAGVFLAFLFGIAYASAFISDPKQKGVVAQAFFRSNVSIIGIPLGEALGGTAALSLISVVASCTVAELNILAVIVLTMFLSVPGSGRKKTDLLTGIIKNPLIRSLAAGFLVLLIRRFIPAGPDGVPVFTIQHNLPFVYRILTYLSQLTTPLALLTLGGQFRFSAVGRLKKQIISAIAGCNFLMPGTMLTIAVLLTRAGVLSFGPEAFATLIPVFASPVSFSSGIMAREMDNDGELAAQIIVWSNLVSVVSLFLWVSLLLALGYLDFI